MLTTVASVYEQRANRRCIAASMRAPMLTHAREIELARRWREAGDADALDELISAHARLAIGAAARYRRYGLPMGDLVQEGMVGLLLAARRFDPDREARFSTYAGWWIRSSMQDYVLRNWSVVRIGTTSAQKALFFNLGRLRARIEGDREGPLTAVGRERIAAELRGRIADVDTMEARRGAGDQSLNAPLADGDRDVRLRGPRALARGGAHGTLGARAHDRRRAPIGRRHRRAQGAWPSLRHQ